MKMSLLGIGSGDVSVTKNGNEKGQRHEQGSHKYDTSWKNRKYQARDHMSIGDL